MPSNLALVLTGGGARAAYHVGVLRGLGRRYPDLRVDVLTGVSAGAFTAAFLGSGSGSFGQRTAELAQGWLRLDVAEVFRVDALTLGASALKWGLRLVSGGHALGGPLRGLVDTRPLWTFMREHVAIGPTGEIVGIQRNLDAGRLRAVAVTALSYSTGQTITFVQGSDIVGWERPNRKAIPCRIRIDHVMASGALPLLFPAVHVGGQWFGDGGIRLSAPLSPAVHLGAQRILAIASRRSRTIAEADEPVIASYPPPAQVAGMMFNSIFLDLLDQDAHRMAAFNDLLTQVPDDERGTMRPIALTTLRPSGDLGRMAGEFESRLPWAFRFMTRGLGTRETRSNDLLSLLMFQPDYISRLIELGEADVEARAAELDAFLVP